MNRNSAIVIAGMAAMALIVGACQPISPDRGENDTAAPAAVPAVILPAEEQAMVDATLAQVEDVTGVAREEITLASIEAVDWPDASLGCPQPDYVYAAVVTPGYLIILDAGGEAVEVHTSMPPNAEVIVCTP